MTWTFTRHLPVYLPGGARLGRVEEVGHAADILHIQEGTLLVRDWYVPMTAVVRVDARGVYLNTPRAKIEACGWNAPSKAYLASQGSTPGYEQTAALDIQTAAGLEVIAPGDETGER